MPSPQELPRIQQDGPPILRGDEELLTTPLVYALQQVITQGDKLDDSMRRSEGALPKDLETIQEHALDELRPVLTYFRFIKAKREAISTILDGIHGLHGEVQETRKELRELYDGTCVVHADLRNQTIGYTEAEQRKTTAWQELQQKSRALEAADQHRARFLATQPGPVEAQTYLEMQDGPARPTLMYGHREAQAEFQTLATQLLDLEMQINASTSTAQTYVSSHGRLQSQLNRLVSKYNALLTQYRAIGSELSEASLALYAQQWANKEARSMSGEEIAELGSLIVELADHSDSDVRGRHAVRQSSPQPDSSFTATTTRTLSLSPQRKLAMPVNGFSSRATLTGNGGIS